MTDKYNKVISIILEHEGGYVNNPNDPGGETKYGISKKSYPNLDIKSLTSEQAKQIYYNDFWVPLKLDNIESERLRLHLFDFAVNAGKSKAIKTLQDVLGRLETGKMENDTIRAANLSTKNVPKLYAEERIAYYKRLAKARGDQFLKGWLKRVDDIEKKNT